MPFDWGYAIRHLSSIGGRPSDFDGRRLAHVILNQVLQSAQFVNIDPLGIPAKRRIISC